jgi:3-hydroxyacyl-[acyl-carrier-protein] dehydratase|tara:strand:+ start:385 stop:837 length:453 start_codon:yes stop_codon:yes gene_type:complete
MKLNKTAILEYQQNRPPYLMIDFADEVIPGKSAKGYKDLGKDEWFFKVHWPQDPNMPGMLQIESLVQMCALSLLTMPGNKGKLVYLISADKVKLKKKIIPNQRLVIETKINSYNRGIAKCQGKGEIDKKIACSAEFTVVLPHIINHYNKK